jgi:hypothetical protein
MKKLLSALLALTLLFALITTPASAKTLQSAKAEKIFFYATNADEKDVLLKVIPLADLKAISHGQADGKNYYISSTDNYPTPQFCEAKGVTIPELVDYVKKTTTVKGASALSFKGEDKLYLMATDSYGNYNRNWTYNKLYGEKRYYFEGLFKAWSVAWEIAGEDNSKFGLTMAEYNAKYKDNDPNYKDKKAVFDGGVVSVPILATESFSGRTTSSTLVASTEIGIADYIKANGGIVAGSLKNMLTDATALRLALPMTEADLYAAHRTSFDNFKWIYTMKLEQASAPAIKSLGTVAAPVASVTVSGNTLTIAISCATTGASVYYGDDGAPQQLYTKPITIDVAGRDLTSNPVTFYMTAVREGYDDAGIITAKYPALAPSFKTLYSGKTGAALTFAAGDAVTSADWSAWTTALTSVTMKTPSVNSYAAINNEQLTINNSEKTITFSKTLFKETGAYSFTFHAKNYADKNVSLSLKNTAPTIAPQANLVIGSDMTFKFAGTEFQDGLTVYVTPPGGTSSMISSSNLDRTQSGRVTLKAAYFASPGCVIRDAGMYKFSFANSRFDPGTVDISVKLTLGAPVPNFADVKTSDWFYSAVSYVMTRGLYDADGGKISPNAPMTRGMLVTALSHSAGRDVTKEILKGDEHGNLNLNDSITRQDIAVILHRYYGLPKGTGDLAKFTDASRVSDYAKDALKWAVGLQIIKGGGDGKVNPLGTATRAEVAQILLNYETIS